jgi:hypothetical protein
VLCVSFTGCATVALPIAAAVGVEVGTDHSKKYLSDYQIQVSRMSCRQLTSEHVRLRKFNANPFSHTGAKYTIVQTRMKAKGCRIPQITAKSDFKSRYLSWAN